jgi:hypothetical protein
VWSTRSACSSASSGSASAATCASSTDAAGPACPHARQPGRGVLRPEGAEGLHRDGDRLLLVVVEQGQQRLDEPGEVPLHDDRLVAVRVAAALVDRAEDRGRVVRVEEGARAVVDRLAGDGRVVGVHDAVDEADEHPPRHERRLRGDDRLEQRERRRLGVRGRRVVARDRVVDQAAQQAGVAGRPGVLEAPDAQVAAGHASEHRPGQHRLAPDPATGRDDGQRPRRRDAQRVHRLAHDVLAQHRPDRRQPVPAAREGRASRALEVQVAARAVRRRELAEQQRPAVPEPRVEAAELVTGVRLRDRPLAGQHVRPDQEAQAVLAAQPRGVEAEVEGERVVQRQQARLGRRRGLPGDGQLGELAGEAVVEPDGRCRQHAHPDQATTRALHALGAVVTQNGGAAGAARQEAQ